MVNFADLHLHSHFSHLDGFGTVPGVVARAKELNRKAIALTDHGSTSGFVQLFDECKKASIKPIFGYEAYIVNDLKGMFENKQREKNHITLLAKNIDGYRNLLKLATKAYSEGFYFKPTIDAKMLFDNSNGLICFSGCWNGMMQKALNANDVDGAIRLAQAFKGVFGEDYYLETQHFDLFKGTIKLLQRISEETKIPIVATCDPHYLEPSQAEIQEILHAIRDRRTFDKSKVLYGANQWEASDLLMALQAIDKDAPWESIMDRTVEIASSISTYDIPKGGAPKFIDSGAVELLRKNCYDGLEKRGLSKKKEYIERLEYELGIVTQKSFSDYFLITADIVGWAKKNNILVGPGRGSSGGSLICYVLTINEVDPIKHGLIFERFLDIDRYDYPDIDLDFDKYRREEVKGHVSDKYGKDKVTNIATFATFKGKNSLDEIGKVFSVPHGEVETIKKYLVERSEADMRNQLTIEDTFEMSEEAKEVGKRYPDILRAKDLEGQYRHFGRHAAGIVISTVPLEEIMAIYLSNNDDKLASFDMGDLEKLGLLKFDLLGLNELSVIKKTADLAGFDYNDIYKISLDDEKTLSAFRSLDVTGIFQYDGDSTKSILRQMPKITFKELTDCIALSKPGPAHSNATTFYLESMRGKKTKGFNWHPILKDITKDTYGQILYQEQLMRVLREVGSMSWADTGTIRKVISKSKGEQAFEAYWPKFLDGANKNGFSKEDADKLWQAMKVFGRYAFNKCVSGDTVLMNARPNQHTEQQYTVRELYNSQGYTGKKWQTRTDSKKKISVLSMDADGNLRPNRVKTINYEGMHQVFKIVSSSGSSIKATGNHRFMTKNGWCFVEDMHPGDFIAANLGYQEKSFSRGIGKGWRKGRHGGAGDFIDNRTSEVSNFRKLRLFTPCDHCNLLKSRMEVHHVVRNAPNSILEWLCSGCHKRAEYYNGRNHVWDKGFPIGFEEIVSITNLGLEDVYDIEMEDSDRPSFVANNFISHNSHATCYAVLGFWDMFMKANFPLEFFTAKMIYEENDEVKHRLMKTAAKKGYKILPPKIGKSGISWRAEQGGIRAGFSEIKGIGEKTAVHLEEIGASSREELVEKATKRIVNTRILSILDNAKVFDTSLDYDFFNLSQFDNLDMLAGGRTKTLDIDDGGNGYDITISGIFREMNYKDVHEERRSRGQAPVTKDPEIAKYAMMMLEDDTDRVLVMIDRYTFKTWGQKVWDAYNNGDFVVISGKKVAKWRIVRANSFRFYKKEDVEKIEKTIIGKISEIEEKQKDGEKYALLRLEGGESVGVKPGLYKKIGDCLQDGMNIEVSGKENLEKHILIAQSMKIING